MSAPPLVEFIEVTKSYGGFLTVIHDLNLAVQKGEFLTLLGPSGSGKTMYPQRCRIRGRGEVEWSMAIVTRRSDRGSGPAPARRCRTVAILWLGNGAVGVIQQ